HDRDPAGVASHDLDHHDAVMRRRGGVQAVESLGDDAHGAVEADAVLGDAEVVVHGLGDTDHRAAVEGEARGHAQGVVPTDGHEGVDARVIDGGAHAVEAT